MVNINKEKPVLVTGATGYVASWLVKKLLDEGLTVHAAVRDPKNKDKVSHLNKIAENTNGTLKFFKSDLLVSGSYAEAMEGCELVFHTASPFTLSFKDPVKELIEPAQLGTRNVLEQANNIKSVKRVVVTSSAAAIYGDNIDLLSTPNNIFTEDEWNTSSTADHQPYSYSKTLAEKEAWKVFRGQFRWDLVTINPSLVMGPALNVNGNTSESFKILKQMGDGSFKSGVPKLGFGVVDVRDLAEIHYALGFSPDARGRHIASGHNTFLLEMAQQLLPKYGDKYPIPRKELPKWLIWLVAPFVNKEITRKAIARNVCFEWIGDNSKSIHKLGAKYRLLNETMNDAFQQMIDSKVI